ncbi:MAG: hypothetical protein ACRECF_00710 [Methyloceanibacter sp.]
MTPQAELPDLVGNTIAADRFLTLYAHRYPETDEITRAEAWVSFCIWERRAPLVAAQYERVLQIEHCIRLDS